VITLLVSPDDATKLVMGSLDGKIQLALRNTIDSKKNDPPTIQQAELFTPSGPKLTLKHPVSTGKKPVAPPPPAPYVIEVITGNKRENKSFPNAKDH
jgi:Flp pilus assembly protein CpaB